MDGNKEAGSARKKDAKKNPIGYVLGSVALFAVACVAIPAVMTKATVVLYKAAMKKTKDDND